MLHQVRARLGAFRKIWLEFLALNKLPLFAGKSISNTASVSWTRSRPYISS